MRVASVGSINRDATCRGRQNPRAVFAFSAPLAFLAIVATRRDTLAQTLKVPELYRAAASCFSGV